MRRQGADGIGHDAHFAGALFGVGMMLVVAPGVIAEHPLDRPRLGQVAQGGGGGVEVDVVDLPQVDVGVFEGPLERQSGEAGRGRNCTGKAGEDLEVPTLPVLRNAGSLDHEVGQIRRRAAGLSGVEHRRAGAQGRRGRLAQLGLDGDARIPAVGTVSVGLDAGGIGTILGGISFGGAWAMRLKDRIDRQFMSRFQLSDGDGGAAS